MHWVGPAMLFMPKCCSMVSHSYGFITFKSWASYTPRKRDYYEILGVPYDADQHQINNAFIRKSQELHPDGKEFETRKQEASKDKYAPGMTEQFMELKLAYDILRQPVRKKQYDRLMSIERKKRFIKTEDSALYANKENYNRGGGFMNFSVNLNTFIRSDPYVILAEKSDNLLLYSTLGAIALVLIVEYFYVRTLKAEEHKNDVKELPRRR